MKNTDSFNFDENTPVKTIIIQSKNKKETDLILELARKLRMRGRYLSEEQLEDKWLARMIQEAETEGGEVPREKVMRLLKKNGTAL